MSIKFKFLGTILIACMCGTGLFAQDIHFSQFYASPLTLNPALTGKVNGDYRIAGIFRSQWGALPGFSGATFGTPSGSFDMPFMVGKKKTDAIGVGIVVTHDYSSGRNLSMIRAALSLAYHKSLGGNGKHQLSLGLQGGIQQSKTGSFTFSDQYVNAVYNDALTSVDDGLQDQTKIIADFNAGLFYNGAVSKKTTLFAGVSMFHLFEPKEEFGSGNSSKLPRRYVVHAGAQMDLSKRISLYPGLILMNQAKNKEINLGTNLGFHVKVDSTTGKRTTIFLGGWYRVQDAFIAMTGVEWNQFRIGFSYDVRLAHGDKDFSLTNANTRGAFEISAIYVGNFFSIADKNVFLFCPRF